MSSTKSSIKVSWELTATESFTLQNVGREVAQKTKETFEADKRGNVVYWMFTTILSCLF